MTPDFAPTKEQARIITFPGSAFVSACPGAGKTRVLVERVRHLLTSGTWVQGIALLSFTEVAVSELEARLRKEGLLLSPTMPSFIGTFDSFLWRFLVAPFGIPDSTARPRLIPDLELREVVPYPKARAIPLKCFDRASGEGIPKLLAEIGLDAASNRHVKRAKEMRARFRARGELDHEDARLIALERLNSLNGDSPLGMALRARFGELIVDEAQDCNPADLGIIQWFRAMGMPVKVICDPHQSIYGFRGGVSSELLEFAKTFPAEQQLSMNGNFRSSSNIVSAVTRLKRPETDRPFDESLGKHRAEARPVYLLSYKGQSVPTTVGEHFYQLVSELGEAPKDCPVIASTRLSACRALGLPVDNQSGQLVCRLAVAVGDLHTSFELGGRQEALENLHKVVLSIEGALTRKTYRQHMDAYGDKHRGWRPEMLKLGQQLRYDQKTFGSIEKWLEEARRLLEPRLPEGSTKSIRQVLKSHASLAEALCELPKHGHSARTVHSVKGAEFPAVCLVISAAKAKQTLEYLELGEPSKAAEELRKVYVGASRAQRLLVIAIPKSQTKKLAALLSDPTTPKALEVVDL